MTIGSILGVILLLTALIFILKVIKGFFKIILSIAIIVGVVALLL